MVRDLIGPIAAFRLATPVSALPRTRSGKIARKSIADLARNKLVKVITIKTTFFRKLIFFPIYSLAFY